MHNQQGSSTNTNSQQTQQKTLNQQQPSPQEYYHQQMMYQQYVIQQQQQQYYASMQYHQQQQQQSYPMGYQPHQQQYGQPHYQTQYRFTGQQQQDANNQRKGYVQGSRGQTHQQSPQKDRSPMKKPQISSAKKHESESEDSVSLEDEERKVKIIATADSPEEIRKWLESRKRNYPTRKRIQEKSQRLHEQQEAGQPTQQQLSRLEIKLRKQIQFSSCTGKSIEMKARNLDIIRNIITEPARRTKPIKKRESSGYPQRTARSRYDEHRREGGDKQPEVDRAEPPKDYEEPLELPIAATPDSKPEVDKVDCMIQNLKVRRQEQRQAAERMFNYKQNSSNYRYMKNTLTANMVLEDVFKENCYLLQAIRYIVKHDFLEQEDERPIVQPPSEHSEHDSQDEPIELQEVSLEDGELEQGEFAQ